MSNMIKKVGDSPLVYTWNQREIMAQTFICPNDASQTWSYIEYQGEFHVVRVREDVDPSKCEHWIKTINGE